MGEHNNARPSHALLKVTVWMPEGKETFEAPNILGMGLIPGTMVPFVDVKVDEDNIRRLTGFSHTDCLMGPPPSIQVAKSIPKLM